MLSVYVNKFNPVEGTYLENGDVETFLFAIPNQNGDTKPFLSMTVKDEMGNAGSAEFSVDAKSLYYNIWRHMRTLVRVEYDGTTIFYGRVLTIDRDMFRTKKIHCEGAMTFFMDSLYEGTKAGVTTTVGEFLETLVNSHNECMSTCPEKQIQLGEVPGHYSAEIDEDQKIKNDTQKFGAEQGFKTVKEQLDSLISDYAGHMRIRYVPEPFNDTIGQYGKGTIDLNTRFVIRNSDDSISTEDPFITQIGVQAVLLPTIINGAKVSQEEAIQHYLSTHEYLGKFSSIAEANEYAQALHERQDWFYTRRPNGTMYLDWMKNYYNPEKNNQLLSVSQNTIDLSDTVEVDNIFTHVIPIGKNHTCIDAPQGGGAGTGKYAITCRMELDPPSGGIVVPGIICLVINGKAYYASTRANKDDTVKYSISPDPHAEYTFKGWKFSGVSNTGNGEFKMPENDVTITAVFSKYKVDVDPDAGLDV